MLDHLLRWQSIDYLPDALHEVREDFYVSSQMNALNSLVDMHVRDQNCQGLFE